MLWQCADERLALAHDPHKEVHLGDRSVYGGTQPFGLSAPDRRQHIYVAGMTGTGKTTLLRNLLIQSIESGEGVGLIDPHGDLAHEILNFIPASRSRDVVIFNPGDQEFPIAFNVLNGLRGDGIHMAISAIVAAFKGVWRESWGPRMEYILQSCLMALAECENTSLLGVQRMLIDDVYRAWVLRQVRDPAVQGFWREFDGYDKRFVTEAVAPIQNKIGQLLLSPQIRLILGQVRSRIDLRFIMDHRKIFIANLSKGKIGDHTSSLLGALLIGQFHQAALSRANLPEHERKDFFLVVDEFQSFGTDVYSNILSEARKFRLSVALNTQNSSGLSPQIRDSILGNAGNLISFRVGEADAQVMARAFGGAFPPARFTELGNFEVLVKLLREGRYGEPFHGLTLPPQGTLHSRRDALIRQSRQRYATPRGIVEERIERWMHGDLNYLQPKPQPQRITNSRRIRKSTSD
jgi:hypothetical protein